MAASLPHQSSHPPYIPPFHVEGFAPGVGPLTDGSERGLHLAWNYGLEPQQTQAKRKRLKEQDFLDNTNNSNNHNNNSQISSLDIFQRQSVSTGLGLSLDNNARLLSSSGTGDSALLSLIGDEIHSELQCQDAEIDRYLKVQDGAMMWCRGFQRTGGVSILGGVEEESSKAQQTWLLITNGEEDWHIQDNGFSNKPPHHHCYYDVGSEISGLTGRDIGCSCGEWALLTSRSEDIPDVLVNLLSKETIELPLLHYGYDFCILTSPPSDVTCHIVFFNKEENALMICQPGDKEFTIKNWDYESFPTEREAHAVVAGKLFLELFHEDEDRLVMLEFKERNYQFEVVTMDPMLEKNVATFMIFKADLFNRKWIRVKDLGRLAIFIGYETVHCVTVESGIAANSIYFLEEDDLDSYYVYNLEEGSVRMKSTLCCMETTEDSELDWFMMTRYTSLPKLLKEDEVSILQDSEKENKTSGEVEEVEVQESWNTVPPELLNLIQLCLFGRDHAVFRGVCKSWQQIPIQDYSIPPLLSSTTLLEQCQSVSPFLMFQEDRTSSSVPVFRFFDPVHRKMYRVGIPELREVYIHYSRDGWLLVSRFSDESMFFLNPLTQEKIELPQVPNFCPWAYSFSFSSRPTCSNCLVVGMDHLAIPIYTLKHGDGTWREYVELDEFWAAKGARQYLCDPIVLNGLHYFMCESRDLTVFNLKDCAEGQLPDWQNWPSKSKRPENIRGENFFLEIDGVAAFVSFAPDGREVNIFKWNDLEKDWELMEGGVDFGGKEMFLSKRCSFMEKIDDVGGMGNTIFLPMIDDDANDGIFYSRATRRYHTLYNGYSSKRPYNVDKFLDGIWVKPDRNIVGDNNLKWFT